MPNRRDIHILLGEIKFTDSILFINVFMDPYPEYDYPEVKEMVENTKNTVLGGMLAAIMVALPFIIVL